MDNITEKTTVVTDGGKRPLGQFRNKPKWMGVLNALLTECQALESATIQSIEARYLANSTGWALEQSGNLVGMPRPAYGVAHTDDNAYRALIYGRIGANVSHGTEEDLLGILRTIQTVSPQIFDLTPATIAVQFQPSPIIDRSFIREILKQAKAPVTMEITEITATPFGFAGDNTAYGYGVGEIGAYV